MSDLMKVGPDYGGTGTFKPFTSGYTGAQRTQDAHGRFTQAALEERLFCGGAGLTAINAATFTTATTGATMTPIIGVWNPTTNTKNLIILQATLGVTMTALAATGGGPYAWMVSTGSSAISTGSAAWDRKTLTQSGSVAKFYTGGTALTGMSGTLSIMCGSALFGGSAESVSFTATAAAMQTQQVSSVENLDGSIVVPPGGVLALAATTTPVAHSVTASILWEEVPALV